MRICGPRCRTRRFWRRCGTTISGRCWPIRASRRRWRARRSRTRCATAASRRPLVTSSLPMRCPSGADATSGGAAATHQSSTVPGSTDDEAFKGFAMTQRLRFVLVLGVLLTLQAPNLPTIAAGTPSSSGRAFHELNVKGLPNAAGLSMVGARRREDVYSLDVVGSSLVAHPRAPHAPMLTGSELVGLEFELRDAAGG